MSLERNFAKQFGRSHEIKAYESFPEVRKPGSHDMLLEHVEYLADICPAVTAAGLSGYKYPQQDPGFVALKSYPLQPGSTKTFPFGSQIMSNFEEYEFVFCNFEYRSMISDVMTGTNAQLGLVLAATNYDATDPVWSNKIQMVNQVGSQSFKPNVSCVHECIVAQTPQKRKFVRNGEYLTNQDIRMSDLGYFGIVAVQTTEAYTTYNTLGELYVRYAVKLYKQRLWASLGNFSKFYHLKDDGTGVLWNTSSLCPPTKNLIVGKGSNMNVDYQFMYNTGGTSTLSVYFDVPGNYKFTLAVRGTSGAWTVPNLLLPSSGVTVLKTMGDNAYGQVIPAANNTSVCMEAVYYFNVSGIFDQQNIYNGQPVDFGFGSFTLPPNSVYFDLFIEQINNNIV